MNINLSISPAPGITNYLIAAVYEATNPNVAVQFEVLPRPLLSDVNVTFVGLNTSVHYVIIWENTTVVPGGSIRHRFIYDPEYSNATISVRDDLYLTVGDPGDNPVAGESDFTLASLEDWIYTIERRGWGSMQPSVDVLISPDRKTFTLIKDDGEGNNDVFGEGEVFILHFEPKVTTNQPIETLNSGRVFSATETLTENTTLTSAAVGKAFKIQGVNDTITITLPAINTMPENRHIAFISEGGSHKNATIQANGSDTIEWLNGKRQNIILGQSERVWIYVVGGVWVVSTAYGGFSRVGEIYMSYDNSDINAVFANGALLSRTVYARLWEWVQNADPSLIVSDANWNNAVLNNKGKFSFGDGSTNFRVPLLSVTGFLRGVDSISRIAGSFEVESVGPHTHEIDVFGMKRGTGNDPSDASASKSQFSGMGTAGIWTSRNATGSETRPANVGVYYMIRA
jgi:hypothetical protein